MRTTAKRGAPQTPYESAADRINALQKNAFAAQKLWSCSRIKETGFRFCTLIVLDALRICAALTDAGAEAKRRSFRFGRHRRCLPSRQSALSRCAASDEPKCLFAFTDGPKAPSAASTPICAGTAAQRHKALPIEQKSGSEEECAAAAGLSASTESKTQACAARAPARRPAGRRCAGLCEKSRMHQRFFSPVGAKAYPLLRRIWNAAMRAASPKSRLRGRSLRLCAGRCGIACRRSARRRPTAKPKRPSRFRPNPLRVSARRIGKRRGRKRRSGFRCEQKTSAARSRRRLLFTRFSSRRGRTEG